MRCLTEGYLQAEALDRQVDELNRGLLYPKNRKGGLKQLQDAHGKKDRVYSTLDMAICKAAVSRAAALGGLLRREEGFDLAGVFGAEAIRRLEEEVHARNRNEWRIRDACEFIKGWAKQAHDEAQRGEDEVPSWAEEQEEQEAEAGSEREARGEIGQLRGDAKACIEKAATTGAAVKNAAQQQGKGVVEAASRCKK